MKKNKQPRYFLQFIDGQHRALSLYLAFTKGAINKSTEKIVYVNDQLNENDSKIMFDLRETNLGDNSNFSTTLNMRIITPKIRTTLSPQKLSKTSLSICNSLNNIGQEAIDVLFHIFKQYNHHGYYLNNTHFFSSALHFSSSKTFDLPWLGDADTVLVSMNYCVVLSIQNVY